MRSIGIDLDHWTEQGLLQVMSSRPTYSGLEMHLASIYRAVSEFQPDVVAMDPITGFDMIGSAKQVTAAITRLLDFFKARQITALFTALASNNDDPEDSEVGVSSWIDCWIQLRTIGSAGLRRRGLYVIKVRGMPHSDRIHELKSTSEGLRLGDFGDFRG
jgi:circadian clock protein KaiC